MQIRAMTCRQAMCLCRLWRHLLHRRTKQPRGERQRRAAAVAALAAADLGS